MGDQEPNRRGVGGGIPAVPGAPWVIAATGLLFSLVMGLVAALASGLVGRMGPTEGFVGPLVPWAGYALALALMAAKRIIEVDGRKMRVPWSFGLGLLAGTILFASY